MAAVSLSVEFDDLAMRAVACERFAVFLRSIARDDTATVRRLRDAHAAYKAWGAMAKVWQLEKEMPELLSQESSIVLM